MTTKSEDWESPETIIRASYDCISGHAGEERDWARLKALYAPGAHLIPIEPGADGVQRPNMMTMGEYIESRAPLLASESFFEWETDRQEDREGCTAHVWSTYEAGRTLHGEPIRCGVNSVQLWHDGARWWIMSMTWDAVAAKKAVSR
jgi:hypothetical protein